MRQNKKETTPATRKKRFGNRWLLALYDLLLLFMVDVVLLVLYRGMEGLKPMDIVVQGITAAACIFFMRWFWKVYSQVWRYGGIQSYIRLLVSDGCAFLLYYLVEQFLPVRHISFARVLCISCLSLLGSLTIRMVYRYAYKCCDRNTVLERILNVIVRMFAGNRIELDNNEQTNKIRVAIVGAGKVGVSLAEELLSNRTSAYVPKCFIDTDPEKTGRQIQGIPVIADDEVVHEALEHYGIQEIIIALPQLSSEEKKELYEKYKPFRCKIKIYDYPTMQQAGESKRHLREFDVEELLFRKPIVVTDEKTGTYYRDKVVLITRGGGSIGSELCRQVAKMFPKQLILLDIYENGVYDVQQELKIAYKNNLDVCVEILSVCNRPALERVFDRYRPQIVIHAAAHKHVPLMEHNCCEAIENNVFGTLNTVELAEKYRVQRFMMAFCYQFFANISPDDQLLILLCISSTDGNCLLRSSGRQLVILYSLTPIGFDISFSAYSATRSFLLLQSSKPIDGLSSGRLRMLSTAER